MSGIDEGIPFCPECQKKFGVTDGPSYWIGYYRNGSKIWLIHDRFKKESTQYRDVAIIFSTSFDEIDSKYFDGITRFECGYSSDDRREILETSYSPEHRYIEKDDFFKVLQRAYMYGFDKSGGCFVG